MVMMMKSLKKDMDFQWMSYYESRVSSLFRMEVYMRTERLLRADGIIYGNVKGYYEDKHTYTFVINRKDIVFPKARYKLNKKDRYYDMDNR